MPEIQKHFLDANGNHYVASFFSQDEVDAYAPPEGASLLDPPPTDEHRWIDGAWTIPTPTTPSEPMPDEKLSRLLASVGLTKAELKALLK